MLWLEKILSMIPISFNLLTLVLCLSLWSSLENGSCIFEKNVYSAASFWIECFICKNMPLLLVGPTSTLATSCEELTYWKRLWCWEGLGAGGEGDDRGWDGWMASLTRWMWDWVNSRSWWWTGRPGVLWFTGSQRVGHNWVTELNCTVVGTLVSMGWSPPPNCLSTAEAASYWWASLSSIAFGGGAQRALLLVNAPW